MTIRKPHLPFPPADDSVEHRRRRKLEAKGRAWRYRPDLERAIALRDSDPAAYGALGSSIHMQVGFYEKDKVAANAIGVDVSGGAA